MLENPNALIGDPDEMDGFKPQGPGELPSSSNQVIKSGMKEGAKFATVDKEASDLLYKFCTEADQGVRSYVKSVAAASVEYKNTDLAGREYMNAAQLPEARFQQVITKVDYGSVPGGR